MSIIKAARIDFGASTEFKWGVGHTPGAKRFGFAQFVADGYKGKLHQLGFAQNFVLPEMANADTVWIFTDPLNSWDVGITKADSQSFDVRTAIGAINIAKAIATGITNGSPAPATYQCNLFPQGWTLPFSDGAGGVSNQATAQGDSLVDVLHGTGTTGFLTACLAYASEIAQWCVNRNIAASYQDIGPFTGEHLAQPTSGAARNAKLTFTTTDTSPDYNFGATGIPMLGWYAWEYDGFYGPLQYINDHAIYTEPEAAEATGIYVICKNGITCSGLLGVAPYDLVSMASGLGEINLLASVLTGLGL